jgi:hypothetical protein
VKETLEQRLRQQIEERKIDINGRIQLSSTGSGVHVYWHPSGVDGLTVDLQIDGDKITELASVGVI